MKPLSCFLPVNQLSGQDRILHIPSEYPVPAPLQDGSLPQRKLLWNMPSLQVFCHSFFYFLSHDQAPQAFRVTATKAYPSPWPIPWVLWNVVQKQNPWSCLLDYDLAGHICHNYSHTSSIRHFKWYQCLQVEGRFIRQHTISLSVCLKWQVEMSHIYTQMDMCAEDGAHSPLNPRYQLPTLDMDGAFVLCHVSLLLYQLGYLSGDTEISKWSP